MQLPQPIFYEYPRYKVNLSLIDRDEKESDNRWLYWTTSKRTKYNSRPLHVFASWFFWKRFIHYGYNKGRQNDIIL